MVWKIIMKVKNKTIGRNIWNDTMSVTFVMVSIVGAMLYFTMAGQTVIKPTTIVVIIDSLDTPVGYKPVGILEFEGLSYGYKYNPFRSSFELYEKVG